MAETWYRGEGVKVPPAKPKGMFHDFGDGVYFADTIEAADAFAKMRSADQKDQRLYMVKVDMSRMRVLNLTADSRWVRYMDEPLSPSSGISRMAFLKQMPSAEHYNSYFKAFLGASGVKIEHYDAVVGPLIQHGGNQMCILHK